MIRLSHHLVKRRASRSPVGSPMPSAAKRKTTGWSWPRRRIDFARPVLAARPGRPPRFAGRPPCFSPLRRAGVHARRTLAISKIGASRRRGVRRDEGIPPYVSPDSRGRPGWPKTQNLFVGAGFTAPAGAFRRPTAAQRRLLGRRSRPRAFAPPRGSRDDASIVPYRGCNNAEPRSSHLAGRSSQGRDLSRLGNPAPPRGPRDDASIVPYTGLQCRRVVVSRLAVRRAAVRRGGFHIRPGRWRRRKPRRDEGIPPYGRPGGGGRPGWPKT